MSGEELVNSSRGTTCSLLAARYCTSRISRGFFAVLQLLCWVWPHSQTWWILVGYKALIIVSQPSPIPKIGQWTKEQKKAKYKLSSSLKLTTRLKAGGNKKQAGSLWFREGGKEILTWILLSTGIETTDLWISLLSLQKDWKKSAQRHLAQIGQHR